MNKTIIININGLVFHIEEDAYEVLKAYMTDVKKHFAYTRDSDEIVSDIENRIAEMFSERLNEAKKQVVDLEDTEQVIAQMGSVNEFFTADENDNYTTATGGSVDKKLFRDTDDRIIAGVCAGIGHYFNIEPRWVRIIALIFFFMGGSGFLIYVILWIAMPLAKTRADKMAMKGEEINLQNFQKSFDEEVEALKNNFSKAHSQAKPAIDKLGSFFSELFGYLAIFVNKFLKILVKIIGGFIILIGVLSLFGAVAGLLTLLGFWNSGELNNLPFAAVNQEFRLPIYFSAFVLIVIPLVALILFAIRVVVNRKVVTKTGSFAMLVIWLTGLVVGIYYGSRLGADFSEEATFTQNISITPKSVLYLQLNKNRYFTKDDSLEYSLKDDGKTITNNNDDNAPRSMKLYIERSDVENPMLVEEFSARGLDFKSALRAAQRTQYHFSQSDSLLQFDWATHYPKKELWRCQEVKLRLLIPKNTNLIIDGKLNRYLQDFNLEDCQSDDSDSDTPTEWLMTEQGLKCKNDSLYTRKHNQ